MTKQIPAPHSCNFSFDSCVMFFMMLCTKSRENGNEREKAYAFELEFVHSLFVLQLVVGRSVGRLLLTLL